MDKSPAVQVTTPVQEHDDVKRVRALARALDTAVRIPGTSIRFGLDSIIGLVPGAGDVVSSILSGYIVLASARLGVPPWVVVRMILNLGVDTLVGSVPLVGDLFDVGFRANTRNAALLEKHVVEPDAVRRSSKVAVMVAVAGVVVLAAGGIALAMLLVRGLNWLAGS